MKAVELFVIHILGFYQKGYNYFTKYYFQTISEPRLLHMFSTKSIEGW